MRRVVGNDSLASRNRSKIRRAASFQLYTCGAKNCGLHIVSLDPSHKPICTTIIARDLLPEVAKVLEQILGEHA